MIIGRRREKKAYWPAKGILGGSRAFLVWVHTLTSRICRTKLILCECISTPRGRLMQKKLAEPGYRNVSMSQVCVTPQTSYLKSVRYIRSSSIFYMSAYIRELGVPGRHRKPVTSLKRPHHPSHCLLSTLFFSETSQETKITLTGCLYLAIPCALNPRFYVSYAQNS
jgi:hypothetical protein